MESILPTKQELRAAVKLRLGTLDEGTIRTQGATLAARLASWAEARGFRTVLATVPLPGEPDLTAFLAPWAAGGRRLAFARTGPARSLTFHYVSSLDGPWDTRPFGLREPPLTAPAWEPGEKTLVLVPGLAFAPAPGGGAHRLGRGAGYYDRWLAVYGKDVFALGVGLSVQTVKTLPVEAHDRTLDGWIDPSGFHGFSVD